MKTKSKSKSETVEVTTGGYVIKPPKTFSVCVEVEGTAPMIQNNFSQKAVEQILRKHMGISVQREPKNPRRCIEDAMIKNTAGVVCVPSTAFKKAMLTASTQIKGLFKTRLRQMIWLDGNSVPITYSEMVPRMDVVRNESGVPDVRFRPMFMDWKARFTVSFSEMISADSVVDLVYRAGSVGLAEWRPEKDGTHGTFQVSRLITSVEEMKEVRKICKPTLVPLVIPDWAMDVEISPDLLKRIAYSENKPAEEEVA